MWSMIITEAPVSASLASFADKLISTKLDPNTHKDKFDTFKPPKNVEFLAAPQVNPPVWASLTPSVKSYDSGLQQVQQDLLLNAVPTLKVMEKLNSAQDDWNNLDTDFGGQPCFLGSANVGLVSKRRSLLKSDLPLNM